MIDIDLTSEDDTARLGAALAHLLQPGDVVALYGELGAGKTTLARGIIRALAGAETEVPSPTYTLVQLYDLPGLMLWHFDLYRIETPEAVIELGWQDTQDGAALVEWPERAGPLLPLWRLDLTLTTHNGARTARLEPRGEDWHKRLHGFAL